jgi:ribosomal protein S18 acetylase RimI-like enzyme
MDAPPTIRPSTPADAAFFYRIVETTMKGFIISTWGAWDDERVKAEAVDFGQSPNAEVIEVSSEPVGILLLRPETTHLYVRLICLVAAAQRSGIGSFVIHRVIAMAAKKSVPVRLRVVSSNPAKAFYEKLGFRVTEATSQFVYMERAA